MIVLVTDPRYEIEHVVSVVRLARETVPDDKLVVQHRDKASPVAERDRALERLLGTGARVVLNGTPEDALRLGAHGVHLPGPAPDIAHARAVLGEDAWVSNAAHDDDAVQAAVGGRATATLVSPIYDVPEKAPARGPEVLRAARMITRGRVLVVALGGIDSLRRAASCMHWGADGVAVMRAIFESADPARAVLELSSPWAVRRP